LTWEQPGQTSGGTKRSGWGGVKRDPKGKKRGGSLYLKEPVFREKSSRDKKKKD